MPLAYLPSTQNLTPTTQMRRRFNQTVSTLTNQVGSIATGTGDLGALSKDKAPAASPTFTGIVTQPAPAVLTAATTATSATAGSATALPSAPLGYMEMSINGTTVKIPYYQP